MVALQVARDLDDADAPAGGASARLGRSYVGKLFNDEWRRQNGLLGADEAVADYDWRDTRPEVMARGEVRPGGWRLGAG